MTHCQRWWCIYCSDISDRLTRSTERLLTTLAELETQLDSERKAKDRAVRSLHDMETSSKLVQERCRNLEATCDQLKNERDKCQQQVAQLQSDSGWLLLMRFRSAIAKVRYRKWPLTITRKTKTKTNPSPDPNRYRRRCPDPNARIQKHYYSATGHQTHSMDFFCDSGPLR